MKKFLLSLVVLLSSITIGIAQEIEQIPDSVLVAQQKIEQQKQELEKAKQEQNKIDKA